MTTAAFGSVSEADLERELAMLRVAAAGKPGGVFGPESMVWRVDRESAIFLGAGRALLLQLAHPWVAAAIAQHSRSLTDPIGRFHRTFGFVFTMVFGTSDEAINAARRLHHRHAKISGVLVEDAGMFRAGLPYRANDVAALRWVFATLADSAIVAFDLVNPAVSAAERETYYREFRLFAAFFGIPQSALPGGWPAFTAYVAQTIDSDAIAVTGAARAIAGSLFAGAGTWLPSPSWYQALTASILPERLRDDFGMAYGPREQRAAKRALTVLRFLYPRIPRRLRYVAPYQEARARLAGRPQADPVTRLMNRVWIGRNSMAG